MFNELNKYTISHGNINIPIENIGWDSSIWESFFYNFLSSLNWN